MTQDDLATAYRDYIACLNVRDWDSLGRFVHRDVHHNGVLLGLSGYRHMLESDVEQIPDLVFDIRILIATPPRLAARLWFDVAPKADFLGLPVNGRRVGFAENVFYEFREGLIREVWSVVDKAAIEAQLKADEQR
ncbi:SnoaL-like domain-containing protein [Luteibacter jiangsuensis]|uniref:SnoaL-like domain-containing protein n=1 Tax=Luteibacter jiangsuensis TaxID=637577 RepID=A0ABX0Q7Z8_9GAMM|nr:ester cyclase [Luteibacter jiangsuensis]NID05762.1 SnoaL-like domain-containing protein [Luteibacter jiangsuensis]